MELVLRQKLQRCSEYACGANCNAVSFVNDDFNFSVSEGSDILWLTLCLATRDSWPANAIHEQYRAQWTGDFLQAATSRINTLFTAQRSGRIVSIWLATADVFTAGVVLLDLSLRHSWIRPAWSKALRRASSLLAGFSELWEGARLFRDVFDAIAEKIFDRESIRRDE